MENEETMVALISKGVDRARLGEALAVYDEIAACGSPVPQRSHYALGWIIYYALHQADEHAIDRRRRLLDHYLRLTTPRPHKLHSMILCEAIRLRENVVKSAGYARNAAPDSAHGFSIVRFLPLWNPANLRPGDWNRHELEGKKLSSTVEKLITLYVGEAEKTAISPSPEFMDIIDNALGQYPDSSSLLSQRASLHAKAGADGEAIELLKKALLLAPGKFHLWSRLAALVDKGSSPRLKLALLARGLASPGQEDFKGRIRLELADVWLSQSRFAQAAWELALVKRLYESKQWHLPRAYGILADKIPQGTVAADTAGAYSRVLSLADDFIYSALPAVRTRKNYHKNPDTANARPGWKKPSGPAWRVADESGVNYWFQPQRFGISPDLPMGTEVVVRILNGKIVHAALL